MYQSPVYIFESSLCREITTMQTCVGNCNDPADAEMKQKAQAILVAVKDIVCDAGKKLLLFSNFQFYSCSISLIAAILC